jgi:hypothetical protein
MARLFVRVVAARGAAAPGAAQAQSNKAMKP